MAYTSAQVLEHTRISYRQLDHWARQSWLKPELEGPRERKWSPTEFRVAVVMSRLVKVGMHAPDAARIARRAVEAVQAHRSQGQSAKFVTVKLGDGVAIRMDVTA
jgi:DNA-binding transcriptional MerR regulator